jgi:hypothetical protein
MDSIAVDPKWIRKVARQLTSAVSARYGNVTDLRLDRVWRWAMRSRRNLEATFAAVQMLRDLETIDRAEAAYLFSTVYDRYSRTEREERHEAAGDAILDGVEVELVRAAARAAQRTAADIFYRERGEEELAELALRERTMYELLCTDGQHSLFEDKPKSKAEMAPPELPAPPRDLAERIVALAATESGRERVPVRETVNEVLGYADPAATVAAIQSVRAIGGITFDESVDLLETAIEPIVSAELDSDREYHRLQRAVTEFERRHWMDEGDGIADEARPFEWRVLEYRRIRRSEGITAVVLRRFGEHRLANLLFAKPKEYYRILDETQLGARKVTG